MLGFDPLNQQKTYYADAIFTFNVLWKNTWFDKLKNSIMMYNILLCEIAILENFIEDDNKQVEFEVEALTCAPYFNNPKPFKLNKK